MSTKKKSETKPVDKNAASQEFQVEIGSLAYFIWESEGRPHGRDTTHWLEAEKQVREKRKPGAVNE